MVVHGEPPFQEACRYCCSRCNGVVHWMAGGSIGWQAMACHPILPSIQYTTPSDLARVLKPGGPNRGVKTSALHVRVSVESGELLLIVRGRVKNE